MSVQVQLRRDTYANVAANHGAAGEVFVDTTNQRLVVQDGATAGGFPAPVTLFVGNGGSTNDSAAGSGAFINFTPTFTIPANFMIAKRVFRVSVHLQLTTGSAAPNMFHQILLGTTVIGQSALIPSTPNLSNNQYFLNWLIQATQAPSAASNVQCAPGVGVNAASNTFLTSVTAMPAAVATNAAQALTIAFQWATAGTGTNTIGLNQLIVEALN